MKPLLVLALACLSCAVYKLDLPMPTEQTDELSIELKPTNKDPAKDCTTFVEQHNSTTPELSERQKFLQVADALFVKKEYERAAEEFLCLNTLHPSLALLYNAAQSYYECGEMETDQQALFLFQETLRLYPNLDRALLDEIQQKISEIILRDSLDACDF